ncbi:MAG: hypothetical protein VX341_02980, partial [Bdellovibrionota bacterium]|nr:hypothetical protein [Bdellovibrionota bacterium]
IVKRSLFDARSKTRLGTKQYSQAAEQCHRSVTEQLKELIRSEDFNNYLSDYDISLLNIDIIDSTEALENVDPSLSLINHEKNERKVLVDTRIGQVFDRRRDKKIREDSRLYKYKLMKYGYETYECYQRGPGGGGYGTCKSEEWIYDIEIFDIIGTPAHSSLNIQIPLILNENNEVECRSPLSVEHITEAISFYNKSKDGIALSDEDKHVMSYARHKLTKSLEKGQSETRRSGSLKK